jgi:sorbitol-specific phosphotransferase system component IIA
MPGDLTAEKTPVDLPGAGLQLRIGAGAHLGSLALDLLDDLGHVSLEFALRDTARCPDAHLVPVPLPVDPRAQTPVPDNLYRNRIFVGVNR